MKIYLVGGAVRDRILGMKSNDRDYVVVGGTPQKMIDQGFKQVGKSFPVFLHPETGEEYALARKEVKTGKKHTDFEFIFSPDVTLEEDLKRRDLTINAIAYDSENKIYIDPFDGISDIFTKCLRATSDHFVEDPLRVLRVARFASQLNFNITYTLLYMMLKMTQNGDLNHLTPEECLEN